MISNGTSGLGRNGVVGVSRFNDLGVDVIDLADDQKTGDDFFCGSASEDSGDDFLFHLSNTLPVDDTCPLEDLLETQLVDSNAETQMVDHSVEVLDDSVDSNCSPVQFSLEFDAGNVAKETVVDSRKICQSEPVTEVLILDSSTGNPGDKSVITENVPSQYPQRQDENVCGTSDNKECHSGPSVRSFSGGFTSMRVADFRARGLAARANRNTCPSSSKPQSCEYDRSCSAGLLNFGRTIGEALFHSEHEPDHGNWGSSDQFKIRKTTVRKLFCEGDEADVGLSEFKDKSGGEVHMPELLSSDDCFGGLSYVDSQEPGEFTQSHALKVVDNIINLNSFELEEDCSTRFRTTDTMNTISSAKGCRNLAQSSVVQSVVSGCEIFDWNEKCNDGGGDFFVRKRKLFFDDGISNRSLTGRRKPKCLNLRSVDAKHDDQKEQKDSQIKAGNPVHSDFQVLHNRKANRKSLYQKEQKLASSLNEDLCSVKPDLVCSDIGPNTQMAVEAIESLCFEVHLDEKSAVVSKKRTKNSDVIVEKVKKDGNAHPKPICKGVVAEHPGNREAIKNGASSNSSPKKSRRIGLRTRSKVAGKKELSDLKHHSVEQLENGSCRTRKCNVLNGSALRLTRSSGAREGKCDLSAAPLKSKKRITANCRNDKVFSIEKARDPGPCKSKKSREEFFDISGPSSVDGVESTIHVTPLQQTVNCGSSLGATQCDTDNAKTSAENARIVHGMEFSAREIREASSSACTTPHDFIKKVNDASPICMGDEYPGKPCRKRSLTREINNLVSISPQPPFEMSVLRKRREIGEIRVLFSQHLDENVIKQQKKILARLGGKSASSISDATHFVADEFVRTRNMLEAIAFGKPVVSQLWIESCGQAKSLIDEKKFILRDAKKEKEFGFSLPASLAKAYQHPLLQGRKVLITANAKPGKDTLVNLVKAVGGFPIERISRCMANDEKLVHDLLILSCQEDYDICVPLLQKGIAIYSTELLLNGIVKQTLEYETHLLFADKVKKTRSTVFVKTKVRYPPVKRTRH